MMSSFIHNEGLLIIMSWYLVWHHDDEYQLTRKRSL